jgi:hypothetical protein
MVLEHFMKEGFGHLIFPFICEEFDHPQRSPGNPADPDVGELQPAKTTTANLSILAIHASFDQTV